MSDEHDQRGYYRTLGLSTSATADEIKRAYRKLAKDCHPDKHPDDPLATSKFQDINEAYRILSDPELRARYDTEETEPEPKNASEPPPRIDPIVCTNCKAVSAQPRYVIFWHVVSLVFSSRRTPLQGIYCPSCAAKYSISASAITWMLGWWGFPWGPIWSIAALYRNLLGGQQPPNANAQILARQALYFWQEGKNELAAALVNKALHLKIDQPLFDKLVKLRQSIPANSTPTLVDKWVPYKRWSTWAQIFPIAALGGILVWYNSDNLVVAIAKKAVAHTVMASPVFRYADTASARLTMVHPFENFQVIEGYGRKGFSHIVTANGTVGYIMRMSVLIGDGAADLTRRCFPYGAVNVANGSVFIQRLIGPHTLTVHNGLSSDAVVKLREASKRTALSFYVRANSDVTLNTVPEGAFTIEYAVGSNFSSTCGYFLRDMVVQRFVQTATFSTERRGKFRYTTVFKITLNPVTGGTARTERIDGSEFEND